MAVTVTRGEGGAATLAGIDLCVLSLAPRVDPPLYAPPLPGYDYPLNYAMGIYVPSAVARTNVFKEFWTTAVFGAWFDVDTATRQGDVAAAGTLLYSPNNGTKYGQSGCTGAGFTIDIVQGMPVDLTMNCLSTGTLTPAAGSVTRTGTSQPAMSSDVVFTGPTGVHRCTIAFSNNCRPSGELSSSNWPAAITADAPSFTVTVLQKRKGVVASTTMAVAIAAPGGSTLTFTMLFQPVSDAVETVAFGEQLIETTYQGMKTTAASVPFSVA